MTYCDVGQCNTRFHHPSKDIKNTRNDVFTALYHALALLERDSRRRSTTRWGISDNLYNQHFGPSPGLLRRELFDRIIDVKFRSCVVSIRTVIGELPLTWVGPLWLIAASDSTKLRKKGLDYT